MLTIKVTVKDAYGQKMVYPFCDQAKRLAAEVGSKMLTTHTLRRWVALGGKVVRVESPGNHPVDFARAL